MTAGERRLLEDAENEAANLIGLLSRRESSGVRPPPTIEVTETTVDPETFGSEFGNTEAQAESSPPCDPCPDCTATTGACCVTEDGIHPTGDCYIDTQANCEACCPVYIYQGDGTTCDPNPCACPIATPKCDSIKATKTKCGVDRAGIDSPASPGRFFTFLNVTWNGSMDTASAPCGSDCHWEVSTSEDFDWNPPTCVCSETSSSGSASRTCGGVTDSYSYTPVGTDCSFPYNENPSIGGNWTPNANAGSFHAQCGINSTDTFSQTLTVDHTHSDADSPATGTFDLISTYSNEYTTAQLETDTIAALPAYSGLFNCGGPFLSGQGCDCKAVFNLTSYENSFTIERFKYKFALNIAACAGMIITWNEHFVPDVGSPTNTPRSWIAAGGETETSVFTCPDPTSNGTTTITDIVVDCTPCP